VTRTLKVVGQLGAVALVLALIGLLAWKLVGGPATEARVGEQVPRFDLPALADGEGSVRIEDHLGKPMVINFWATWCEPCRKEAPILERAWQKYRDQGVVFIGVDIRDFTSDARAFVEEFGMTYPVAYDGPATLWEPWGLTGLPETFVVAPDGTIVDHKVGEYVDDAELEAAIERARS